MKDHKNITSNNQRLVKCVRSLVKVFYFYFIDCAEKIIGVFSSRRPRKHLHVRSRLFVPHSQPASQPASPKWRLMPEELVHKTLKSDFPNNDTISMRSPSSNAIIWWGNIFSQESTAAYKHVYRALSCERNRNKGVRFQGNRLCCYQMFQLRI